ncbi:hypothetical protein [Plectonema radiosum]|uniref:hypothetical protein n=1 Tax=Plectonema radiosum TaxID=945768 RepID=UPI0029815592|nr:hypothetical protein [Plectonema radiosum]
MLSEASFPDYPTRVILDFDSDRAKFPILHPLMLSDNVNDKAGDRSIATHYRD